MYEGYGYTAHEQKEETAHISFLQLVSIKLELQVIEWEDKVSHWPLISHLIGAFRCLTGGCLVEFRWRLGIVKKERERPQPGQAIFVQPESGLMSRAPVALAELLGRGSATERASSVSMAIRERVLM